MQTMGREEYESLLAGAEVLGRDHFGDKVLRLTSGDLVKLFRVKHIISSARIWPHARRFAQAAQCLHQLGIATVRVRRVVRVAHIHRDAVIYTPLPGQTLRSALAGLSPEAQGVLVERLADLLARLHGCGVYFRAIHFGNVLVCEEGDLGLIDVSEARFLRPPLGAWHRARNFRPMLSYDEDRSALRNYGMQRFIDRYVQASGLTGSTRAMFTFALRLRPPLGPGPLPFSD